MECHLGTQLYECDICNKKFKQKKYLRVHIQQHSGETESYRRANQERQYRNTLFAIAKLNTKVYTSLELMRIDRSLVYQSYPADRINTQVIYRFQVTHSFANKAWRHCHSWLVGQYVCDLCCKTFSRQSFLRAHKETHLH